MREISALDPEATYLVSDMTVKEDVERVVARTVDLFGGVDIAVSNVYPVRGNTFFNLTDDDFRADFEALVMSVVYLTRAVAPHMIKGGFGRLINVGSIVMKGPFRGQPHLPSSAFRPGVAGLNKSVAYELAPHGITVNNIGVGFIKTARQIDRYQTGDLTWDEIEAARVAKLGIPRAGSASRRRSARSRCSSPPRAPPTSPARR